LIGRSIEEFITEPQVDQCIKNCLKESAKFTLRELSVEQKTRPLLMDMVLSPINDLAGEPCVLIEINSTDRSTRFIKDNYQLERQQSFRQMMRGLAHEIKNPLSGIRGAAQLLEREAEPANRLEMTGILIKEADRLSHLVDRVMGSPHQLNLADVNIHELLEHVIELVRISTESVSTDKQLDVYREYDPTLPEIKADKEKLIQAILNIMVNACEAQQDNQRRTKIGIVTQFERFVTIHHKMHRRVLKIKIWDEGPGVPEELRGSLFDPLVTGRAEGTGLGLSITQELIQRHRGLVRLEDYQGNTCFTLYLPYEGKGDDG
jgi:two-component system nitrogen regulation sensor histidine kinase GlnL